MRLIASQPGRLETEHTPGPLPGVLAASAAVTAVTLVSYGQAWPDAVLLMLWPLSGLLAAGAWLQSVRTWFEFDAATRRIRWRRSGPGHSRSGTLGFGAVRQVVLQPGPGRRAGRARICLLTAHGIEPLARDFSLDAETAARHACTLRALLGLADADSVQAHARALIRRGDESAAVAWLAERQGLSRDQARELVRYLKER